MEEESEEEESEDEDIREHCLKKMMKNKGAVVTK